MNTLMLPCWRSHSRPIAVTLLCAALSSAALRAQTANSAPASTESDDVVTLSEFYVSSARDTGYMATESTSGTRVATEILSLPYSVQVLTSDFFQDFQLLDLDEQAPFISGLASGDPAQGGGGGTRLRGFFVPYFRNGFYRRQAPDSNSIARVEVIKGPQSAIYGRVSPGGVVNYISKKPQTKAKVGLSYTGGTNNYMRADAYATGPIIDGRLYYRIDATQYDFERPTDYWYNHTNNLSGSLTYNLTKDTSVTLEYEHTQRTMNDVQAFTRWISADNIIQASVYDIPDRAVADRLISFNQNGANRRTDRLNDSWYLQVEHRFDPDLSLRLNAGYSTREFKRITPTTLVTWDTRNNRFSNAIGTARAGRSMSYQTIDDKQYGTQIDLTKVWRGLPGVRQRSLLTFDIFQDNTDQSTWALSGTALNTALDTLGYTTTAQKDAWKYPDIYSSDFGTLLIPAFDGVPGSTGTDSSTYILERFYYGGLFNHSADLFGGRLSLTFSARYDWAEYTRAQPLSSDPELFHTEDSTQQGTYSVGANYHIIPRKLVGFVSYGTSFDPAPQADRNTGEIYGNKTAKGYEIGLKGILLDERFSYTLSGYEVEQDNEVINNPDNPNGSDLSLPVYIAGGSSKGNGFGIDVSGKLTDNLSVLANIAWTDIWIARSDKPELIGTKPTAGQNAPGRSAAIALTYQFKSGFLKGLRVGGNYQYSARYIRFYSTAATASSLPTTDFYLPEKNQFGGFVSYGRKIGKGTRAPWLSFQVNVLNLFDEREITTAAYAPLGREFRLKAGISF